jgi:VanZ family protein
MMFVLMLHAWGTEMLQEMLVDYFNRGGQLSDVAFDVMGIVIGVAISWKWWTRD